MSNAIHSTAFTESFWSHDEAFPYVSDQERANGLRGQIMDILQGGFGVAPALMQKLDQAEEVEGLWFLRIDIMQELSMRLSEDGARSTMDKITALFVGHMPDSVFMPSHYATRMQNELQKMDNYGYGNLAFGDSWRKQA